MADPTYVPFASRPEYGKVGRPSQIQVNYFPIKYSDLGTIHHYDVVISPQVPFKVNQEVFQYFEQSYRLDRKVLNDIRILFDGVKNAFTPKRLPFGPELETEITLPEKNGRSNKKNPRQFTIKLSKVSEIEADIEEMQQRTSSGLTAIMAYNILFRHQPNTKFIQVRDSFFIQKNVKQLGNGIDVWPGFFRSFMPVQNGLALNVDTIVCTFYRPGNLLDLIVAFIGLRERDELRDPRLFDHMKRVKNFVKNLRITLSHRGEDCREFKIKDISSASADNCKFLVIEDGVEKGETTVAQYFSQKLGIRLNFPSLPCVEVKKGVLIPMELCNVLPGQRYSKKLNERQTAEMIKITCIPPRERADKIMKSLDFIIPSSNDHLKQFGLEIEPRLMSVPSRLLPIPTVHYHSSSRAPSAVPNDGVWNLRDKKLFEGKELKVWSVVVFSNESRIRRNTVENFIKEHVNTCIDSGLHVLNTRPRIFYGPPRPDTVEKTLNDAYISTGNEFKMKPQLLLIILPDKGTELYSAIKATCELSLGIPTQCIQSEKISRPNKQYCANVCLKMNAKLGGINAAIHPTQLGDLKSPPTIIIGADISHPPPGADDAPSITACIGSIDFSACRYSSTIRLQKGRVELFLELQEMIVDLLKMFFRTTGLKPARILYFRDGVSEGSFQNILCQEMSAIKKACASLERSYNPGVTFVISQKRHHTRFFPSPANADRSGNAKAGTVVESGICHPTYFDFFLQSHAGLQGTSRPVHYHVLIDENRFGTDNFQRLCYNMCYLFARATRSVSLVPAIYYAHLAATRARCHYKLSDSSDSNTHTSSSAPMDLTDNPRVGPELMRVMYYI